MLLGLRSLWEDAPPPGPMSFITPDSTGFAANLSTATESVSPDVDFSVSSVAATLSDESS